MDKKDLKIIFMGTPEFAVESLKALYEGGYNIVAVVTMPDKPAGRGHQLQFSAVKQYALSKNLPILQPEKLKDEQFITTLRSFQADLQIVVAFRMLPQVVWSMPRLGTFNLHASLLPQYRGAAPINWAIINGDKETGATTFFLKQEIDTGDMILQERIKIEDNENVGSVHDRLMVIGANLVIKTVDLILQNKVTTTPQPILPDEQMRHAPKIFKETCEIDFNKTQQQIHNFVRGLSPYPAAWAQLTIGGEKQIVKIYETQINQQPQDTNLPIGSVITDNKTFLKVQCQDGCIDILQLQLPGKKRMNTKDLLNGLQHK